MADERAALAAEAFIYGFPLVFNLTQIGRFARSGIGEVPATAFNRFGHASTLAGPEATFVSINRATGTAAGSFLLVSHGDTGVPDHGIPVIRFPTAVGTIVGRWAVSGEADLPAVRILQSGLVLSPVTDHPGRGLPEPDASVPQDLSFFEQMRAWMRAFPPARGDLDYQARFEPLGLFRQDAPYAAPDPALGSALREGLARGQELLERALNGTPSPKQNGWSLTYHVFDYNLDFFEVGALDDPMWKTQAEPQDRYLLRAGAARGGLWGNHGYEAAYAMVYQDADGGKLNGGSRYQLRFDQTPPVGAFWSVTMYDTPDFFLVANPPPVIKIP